MKIAIDNDRGPLGIREYPASSLPRETRECRWPLSFRGERWYAATLTVPYPMTPDEWDVLMDTLAIAKAGLVAESGETP